MSPAEAPASTSVETDSFCPAASNQKGYATYRSALETYMAYSHHTTIATPKVFPTLAPTTFFGLHMGWRRCLSAKQSSCGSKMGRHSRQRKAAEEATKVAAGTAKRRAAQMAMVQAVEDMA